MTTTAPGGIRSVAWAVLLVGGVAAACAVAVMPEGGAATDALALGTQLVALACVVWRLRATPPRPAVPWIVFIAGIGVSLAADVVGAAMGSTGRWAPSVPAPVDALYVVSYAMMVAAVALAAWSRRGFRDAGEIVDALIVTATAGVAVFALVLGTHDSSQFGSAAGDMSVVVVVLDVALVGLGSLVFIRYGRVTGAIGLLAGALVAQLVADTLFAHDALGATVIASTAAVPFTMVTSVLFGAAMLHPTIVDFMRVRPDQSPLPARARLAFITAAALTAAVVGLVGQLVGESDLVHVATDLLVIAIVALFAARAWILANEAARVQAALTRTAAALEARTEFVAGIAEAMPGALFSGDIATLTIDYASPGLRALLGADPASVLGKPGWIVERIHPEDRDGFVAASTAASGEEGRPRSYEHRMRTEDGGYRDVASSVLYLAGPQGRPERFVVVAIDVTERNEAERRLRARETFVADLAQASSAIILAGHRSEDGDVIDFISPSIEPVLGYRPDEIVGVPGFVQSRMHPDDVPGREEQVTASAASGGGDIRATRRFRARDGSYRSLELSSQLDAGGDGSARYITSATDVTERVRLEEDLVAARDAAEAANRAKSEFLSLMSHEFRTPLNSILGFGRLLDASDLAPADRESVEYILGSGETLLRMIDRVLDFARLETGRIDLAMETVLAGDAVRRALELVRPLATGFQTVIDERGTQDGIEVRANGQRLVTVIWDLLDNAVRHGGAGVVHVSVVVESAGGGLARIRVTDDGVGMDEDQVQHAFTPFLSGSDGGAALGLSLGRRLVEAMGGTLEIESRLGAGTISTITLPEWRADGPGSGDRAATAHAKAAG